MTVSWCFGHPSWHTLSTGPDAHTGANVHFKRLSLPLHLRTTAAAGAQFYDAKTNL